MEVFWQLRCFFILPPKTLQTPENHLREYGLDFKVHLRCLKCLRWWNKIKSYALKLENLVAKLPRLRQALPQRYG